MKPFHVASANDTRYLRKRSDRNGFCVGKVTHYGAQGKAVVDGQRLSIHFVGKDNLN